MKHLFYFLSIAVLAITACVFVSCERETTKPAEYFGNTKWVHKDSDKGVNCYIELEREYNNDRDENNKKKTFKYKECYFSDPDKDRPQYDIIMTGNWTTGYWLNGVQVNVFFENSEIRSTKPDYYTPKLKDYPQKLTYYKKNRRIKYKGRLFKEVLE